MKNFDQKYQILSWILRITIALTFIGHGIWGLLAKKEWAAFFVPFGIPQTLAFKLMPLIGAIDIFLGIFVLFYVYKPFLWWMLFWGVWTALLRPIAGMSWFEVIERAGNFGPALALLALIYYREKKLDWVEWIVRISLSLLLIGHAGYAIVLQKPLLTTHFASIGINATPSFLIWFGMIEIGLALLVLAMPSIALYAFILAWKLITESLFISTGPAINLLEFIERAGDFGIPIALIFFEMWKKKGNHAIENEKKNERF